MDGLENVAGVEAQEITEPVTQEEPVNNTTEDAETEVSESEATENETETVEPTKTEEDSRFASVRRKAEADAKAKYEAEQSKMNSEVKRLFGSFKNPITNKPIETVSDYFEALEAQQKQQRDAELKDKGIDPKIIDEMVNNSPAVRQANEIMRQNMEAEAHRKLTEDIKTLSTIDPSIKSETDLLNHPSYENVLKLVQNNGLSLPDAFKLANFADLSAKHSAAVKQAAINQAKGKNHLETTSNGTADNSTEVDIPQNELAKWKSYYPGLSEAELKKKYNKTI